MIDDNEPLTKKDLIEALKKLDELKEDIHNSEIRILKSFRAFSTSNEIRLRQLENFAAIAGKRLANLEGSSRFEDLLRLTQIEKKLVRRQ
jgi:hypothetical protein